MNLFDLWLITPRWLFDWILRRLRISDEAMHEWFWQCCD